MVWLCRIYTVCLGKVSAHGHGRQLFVLGTNNVETKCKEFNEMWLSLHLCQLLWVWRDVCDRRLGDRYD